MLLNLKKLAIAAVVGLGITGNANFAAAQGISLGNDDKSIVQLLQNNGYTNPRVTKRGLTIVRAEACKGPDKHLVKINVLGIIKSSAKIGRCAVAQPVRFGEEDAAEELRRAGYRQIRTQRNGHSITATACRQNRKFEFRFNRRGRIADQQEIGACRVAGLSADRIKNILRDEGYRRIEITNSQPPRYTAEACRDRDRMRVQINRRGAIQSERRIGECGRRFNPANLASFLKEQGYDRVVINRSDRAPYLAEGCKNSALIEVTVGRNGRIRNEERVGRCAAPVTKEQITTKLREQGYFGVAVSRQNNGWRAEVCRDETKLTLNINATGKVIRERRSGECRSQTLLQIIQTLESRGAKSTRALVEGCFRGTKYRWEFDRLGNRTGRNRIGNC